MTRIRALPASLPRTKRSTQTTSSIPPKPLSRLDLAWAAFAAANLVAMIRWPEWETIPFHFIWISLTLLYGFRVWRPAATTAVLGAVILLTGGSILADAFAGRQLWGELFEVPLMSAMFLAMVWHARRRQQALEVQTQLVEREEQFIYDASHELRTPVTIARGHLELLQDTSSAPEIDVVLDELSRIESIVDRLLLLAKAAQPNFVEVSAVDLEDFLEVVFIRWAGTAPRAWKLGTLAKGTLRIDPDSLRTALDALLENAVRYTEPGEPIVLRAEPDGADVVIEVVDHGCGVDAEIMDRIFERFARADAARTRERGGAGLGLAIVDAIAKAHGGRCTVRSGGGETIFALHLPGFRPASPLREHEALPDNSAVNTPALG